MSKEILIVDDEEDIRALIRGILEDEGYLVREAKNSTEAIEVFVEQSPDLMILDIWLQDSDEDGLGILKAVKGMRPHFPVLMISGHGTIETAVHAIKDGAYDFIEKPFKSDRLMLMISRALEAASLRQENEALKARQIVVKHDLLGISQPIETLKQQIKKIAPTKSRVLITGEAGTGKEVVARDIHRQSDRADQNFMALNCAALHPERLEEELFGVTKDGNHQKGVLELCDGGTLFLDEVADMPIQTQGKILRTLQDNQIHPIGSQKNIEVDVRVIASTNQDLLKAIEAGSFREDLYYRLNVMNLQLPRLQDRREDIALLASNFLSGHANQTGQKVKTLSNEAMTKLESYGWPGNVRQLKNVMEWLMIMAPAGEGEQIQLDDLPPEILGAKKTGANNEIAVDYTEKPLREAREAFERDYLSKQVQRFKGNVSQTAEFIGMERSALHRKLKSLDISLNDAQDKEIGQNQTALKSA